MVAGKTPKARGPLSPFPGAAGNAPASFSSLSGRPGPPFETKKKPRHEPGLKVDPKGHFKNTEHTLPECPPGFARCASIRETRNIKQRFQLVGAVVAEMFAKRRRGGQGQPGESRKA